jgi:hypothetical protein
MLTQEKITKNAAKYFKTGETYDFMPQGLVELLGVDMIKAPASTHKNMYNAFEGGLIEHLLTVAKYAMNINETLPENMKLTKESILKVALLHQIGKAKLYVPCESQWHRDNQGKMYEFNPNITALKLGERSIVYALSHGVKLTDEEISAIVNFDKTDDDLQAKYHNSLLGDIIKMANTLAIKESQLEQK